jgi:hypothetical protein
LSFIIIFSEYNDKVNSIPKMGRKVRTEVVKEEERKVPIQGWVVKPVKEVGVRSAVKGKKGGGERRWGRRLAGKEVGQVEKRSGTAG